jgi:hypothetical protein
MQSRLFRKVAHELIDQKDGAVLSAGTANRNGQIASAVRNVAGKPLLNKANNVFFHALDYRKLT